MTPWITDPDQYELTEEQYHADPVVGGSLSSSGARMLLNESPAKFRYQQVNGRLPKRAWDLGHAAHREVLGVGNDVVVITGSGKDPDAWNTDKTKAEVKEARDAGLVPIKPSDAPKIREMAAELRRHPIAGPLFARPGRAEQSFVARDPETGILCRVRPDWMPDVEDDARLLIVDYKTTDDAHPRAFAKSMATWGYHQQGPYYCDALSWLGLDHGQPPQFVLVAQEKEPPYLVTVGWPNAEATGWGRVLNRKARDVYARCVEADAWPGYPAVPVALALPGWQLGIYENAEANGEYTTTADLEGAFA